MPVIIRSDDQPLWLDGSVPEGGVRALLRPYPGDELEMYEVSRQVNSPANDSAECLRPVIRTS